MTEKENNLETLRHSCSHLMAQAVTELFPGTLLAIGPSIDGGFYYDFERKEPFTPLDLERIEKKMRQIIQLNSPFEKKEMTREEAKIILAKKGEKYKLEIVEEIPDEKVTFYQQGTFIDLCRGPHLAATGEIKFFKLLSVAGAYWRGSEKNAMLQRIYGTAFYTKEELEAYLNLLEEAKRRDHRKLGKELDLYSMSDQAGAGLIYWHPKGALVRKIIEDFWKDEHLRQGYELVYTPHIAKIDLWKTSGHWDFYRENMYSPLDIDDQEYLLKPMNCPGHILIYKSKLHSYRQLPIRWAELGTVYRYERSGVLHGLLRVRGFTQDDAHIFCRLSQLEEEVIEVIRFTIFMLKSFGFQEYDIYLSTRPEKFVGDRETWVKAEESLKKALDLLKLKFQIDEGAGVFYGPKVDIKIKDVLGRSWQCSTVQIDFNLPERFDVAYRAEDGTDQPVIMIHRALLGSLERFFGVLIEHYAGFFPAWLAPSQVKIMTITDRQDAYAQDVIKRLRQENIRAELDLRNLKLGNKIRDAQLEKVPYMLIIGDQEAANGTIAIRDRKGKDWGSKTLEDFIPQIKKEIEEKI
ncbi:MAG: threonine--tRNA ligase [Elusimicrobiota bacterium]